ncbi:GRAM domain-containing protein 4-like isoform X2 [Notothenia coriiceps]|uniref:GRAM domain-containing protein 4-like isoform X2 n=1 Tax=Notothenia coriiceps TaxID=8208 RepID=A0A6I9PIR0_9TELE|nr:PREDICTED: GRAM domain-containing protein 4-like isoform X2 [Notothenia coriiceps]
MEEEWGGHEEEELRKLREETNVDSLRQELDRERSKRIDLEQKMNEVLKTRLEDSPPQPPRKQQSPSNNGTGTTLGEVERECV